MSYRDDLAALRAYHENLVREVERLRAKSAELAGVEADRARAEAELVRVSTDLEARRARRAPIRLDTLTIASPCHARWDEMTGDDRARHCAICDKDVFDLSAMTRDDAEELLAARGITACVRFYRRADGTVMTADCPVGARRRRRKVAIAAGLVAAGAGAATVAAATRPAPPIAEAPPILEPAPPAALDDASAHPIMGGPVAPPDYHMGLAVPQRDPPVPSDATKDRDRSDRRDDERRPRHRGR